MKTLIAALAILLLALPLSGQSPAAADGPGLEYLKDNFKSPPSEYGPDCWWWWLNGNVTEEAITSDLEAMKGKGFHGAMIFDAGGHNQRGHRDIPAGPLFGSVRWRELFVHALDEAERLGLEIGFNIQSGWNLGGPFVTPENAAKMLTYSKTTIAGGKKVELSLPRPASRLDFYRDIAVLAFPVDSSRLSEEPVRGLDLKMGVHELGGSAPDCRFLLTNDPKRFGGTGSPALLVSSSSIRDITGFLGEDGVLRWKCPEGQWAVLRVGYTCTGAVVSTCSQGWEGLVLDYMDPAAFDFYVSEVLHPIFEAAGHHVGKTLKYMETDSWECGGMNWTEGFEKYFREYSGYDILPYLPVAAGFVVDDVETSDSFLADFRKTIADAVANNHYRRFSELAHSHGMAILPESAGPHAGPLDGIKNYSFSDIMMSEFWAPSPHRPRTSDRFFIKQASSAAHIYGCRIVGAESFTTIGPQWNDLIWHDQKPSFDHEVCAGLNRVYFHTFTCSPKEMGLPGQEYFAGTHINPRLTWWEESTPFMEYLTRVQFLVQNGHFVAQALYYYGDHVPNVLPYKHSNISGTLPGYDFDAADENALLNLEVNGEGRLVALSGMEYDVLVLPSHRVLSLAALEKVGELLRKGATVIGDKPERCVSLKGGRRAQKRFAALASAIWGEARDGMSAAYGKGRVCTGITANEYFRKNGIPMDFSVDSDPELRNFDYIHYRIEGKDVYFISNMTDREIQTEFTFRTKGGRPELWNPLDGSVRELEDFACADLTATLPLRFDPCGSMFIIFTDSENAAPEGAPVRPNFPETVLCQTLDGAWDVTFDPAGDSPLQVVFDSLQDWTASDSAAIKYHSGKAAYSKEFTFESAKTPRARYCIELGSVLDVGFVRVKINGVDKGVVWTAPFRVDVTDELRSGKNSLEVEVVNSWYNRVAGDQLNPEIPGSTSTNIELIRDFRGVRKESITLSPSGLMGPVRLVKLSE
ncbi:MAG: glycosyl hydrolase [Candidatus Cryptobacteroides sp.]